MLIPIRCYTCNNLLGNKYRKYQELILEGKMKPRDILEKELSLKRECCKQALVCTVDMIRFLN